MSLVTVLVYVALVSALLLGLASIGIVGRTRLARLRNQLRPRLRRVLPYAALLGVIMLANKWLRTVAQDVSWLVGLEITAGIYAIEGELVPWIQSFATPPLTAAFSAAYVYGYVFILTFPIVAYLALEDDRPLRETFLAYSYNYVLGLGLYILFIAYGPRNLLPEQVGSLMYTMWPESQLLTSQVNANTNVFPSLHASLSTTVVVLAYHTREVYTAWFYLSSALAGAIMLSTMYLGIHWAIDLLGGIVLGVVSVVAARRWDPIDWVGKRVSTFVTLQLDETVGQMRED